MDPDRLSQYSKSISDWFPNCQESLKSNGHDQEAFCIDSDVLDGIDEVREENDVGSGVEVHAVVSRVNGKKQDIEDCKNNEALNENIINSLTLIQIKQ